jgi:hypothetical protein
MLKSPLMAGPLQEPEYQNSRDLVDLGSFIFTYTSFNGIEIAVLTLRTMALVQRTTADALLGKLASLSFLRLHGYCYQFCLAASFSHGYFAPHCLVISSTTTSNTQEQLQR